MLPNLPIGPYQIEVTKEGFSRYVQTGIVLQVETNPTVDVSLQVGAASRCRSRQMRPRWKRAAPPSGV